MKTRTELINMLIVLRGYKSYMEIGLGDMFNFNSVVCAYKVGVDPNPSTQLVMTSDAYFENHQDKFDLIFIDGLHEAEQVIRDIKNSFACLNKNGTIVVHDCNPPNQECQIVPRLPFQCEWTGDVWKAWIEIKNRYSACVVDIDYGCGIIDWAVPFDQILPSKLEWSDLINNRKELLGLVDVDEWISFNAQLFVNKQLSLQEMSHPDLKDDASEENMGDSP